MVRVYLVIIAVLVAVAIFAVVDAAFADPRRVRALPKPVWIIAILVLPVVGWLLWFLVGRPRRGNGRGSTSGSAAPRPRAPDDDPEFLWKLRRDIEASEKKPDPTEDGSGASDKKPKRSDTGTDADDRG